MRGKAAQSAASASGSSAGPSQTPMSARDLSVSPTATQRARGTIAGVRGTSAPAAASRTSVHRSSTIAPSLMSRGIDAFLERLEAEAADGIDEALVFVAPLDIDVDEPADDLGHFFRRERRADDFAERRVLALAAADRNLVPLLAILVDAEHTDVADVMVAAGVHAARDVQFELADVVEVVEVVEAALNRFRDRNRFGIGERAEIAARAADDIGQESDVRCGKPQRLQLAPQPEERGLPDVGEDQVLFVRNAQAAEAVGVGEIGDRIHLIGSRIARRHAGLLQRQRHHGVTGHLVRKYVARGPVAEG